MWNTKHLKQFRDSIITAASIAALTIAFPASVSAAGDIPDETSLPVGMPKEDIVSVALPVIAKGEKSPFDFILDPKGLLYGTNAMNYGGGTVEEGATILFHNNSGAYDFSKYSDQLTVTNESTIPVTLTLSARISSLNGAELVGSEQFTGDQTRSMYLALVDNRGNVQPFSANGEASLSLFMQAAPESAYIYTMDEEEMSYEYTLSGDYETIGFDSYSFGLTGTCNPNADWKNTSFHLVVTVSWSAEPPLSAQNNPLDEMLNEPDSAQDEAPEDIPGIEKAISTDEPADNSEDIITEDIKDSAVNAAVNQETDTVINKTERDTDQMADSNSAASTIDKSEDDLSKDTTDDGGMNSITDTGSF